jgi:hypothetical protein
MSADQIVKAAEGFAAASTVFAKGCSDMVRQAYAAGGVKIPASDDADAIIKNYPCVTVPQAGDVAGWLSDPADTTNPHGHVVIFVKSDRFVNCPGPNKATKTNTNMGPKPLTYVRPS